MKRSKMIREMAEYWLGLFPGENVDNAIYEQTLVNEAEEKMSNLLSFLEHKGMKPPIQDVCPVLFQTKYVWEQE